MTRIALIGDHDPAITAHRAIPLALERAASDARLPLSWDWIGTETIGDDAAKRLDDHYGIWCVPGSPYRSTDGALAAIRFARESGRPFLGTCGGFQHALLEYARSVWGRVSAAHGELEPDAEDVVIAPLSCSLVNASERIRLEPGSRLGAIYGEPQADEAYQCSYGLAPAYAERLSSGLLRIAARGASGEVRAVELDGHPFYVATLFQPERSALAGRAQPLIAAFAAACESLARRITD